MKFWPGLVAVAVTLSPAAATAQAFGIEMGTPVSELDIVHDAGDFYFIVNPPQTVSGFESYIVYAAPEAGVCVVRGLGENYERDGYGISVRERFQELKELLDKKYGGGVLYDGLRPGALWDEVDEWVMAIRQNERYYQAEWEVNDAKGVDDIIMSVEALSSDVSFIALQYRFSNFEDCQGEARAEDSGGL